MRGRAVCATCKWFRPGPVAADNTRGGACMVAPPVPALVPGEAEDGAKLVLVPLRPQVAETDYCAQHVPGLIQ